MKLCLRFSIRSLMMNLVVDAVATLIMTCAFVCEPLSLHSVGMFCRFSVYYSAQSLPASEKSGLPAKTDVASDDDFQSKVPTGKQITVC